MSRNTVLGEVLGDKALTLLHRAMSIWWHETVQQCTERKAVEMIQWWRQGVADLARAKGLLKEGKFIVNELFECFESSEIMCSH